MSSPARADPPTHNGPAGGVWAVVSDRLSFPRTILWTAPLIIAATVVMSSTSLVGSVADSQGPFQHACARIWSRFVLFVCRVRVRVDGLDRLPPGGRYVLCVNHQSYMDIPVLLASIPDPVRFAAKKELFRIPFLGWHLRRAGHVSVDRGNPLAAVRALERSVEGIRRGIPVVIFPEGRTSRDGEIGPFKGGAFAIAERSGVEIVPVTVRGTRRVFAPGSYRVRGGDVTVTIGERFPSNTMSLDEIAGAVRETIVSVFHGRSATPATRNPL